MKNLTVFYMEGCPYCRNAKKALEELIAEKPAYKEIPVEWVDENKHPERTEGRDYYYVPTIFSGEEKLYEAHPGDDYAFIHEQVKKALEFVQRVNGSADAGEALKAMSGLQ